MTVRPLTATDPVPRCTCRLRNDSETFKLRREATRRVIEDAAHTGVVRRDRYHTKTSPRKCVTMLVLRTIHLDEHGDQRRGVGRAMATLAHS